MYIKALYLKNFRSFEEGLYEFSKTVNVIRGSNGLGKTSLLEAIYFLIAGRSFRTALTTDMIRHGASHFYIEALFEKHGIEQKLKVYYSQSERRVSCNATTYPHLSHLLGLLNGIAIHPDDANIVKGAPLARRQLLDTLLAQKDPLYVHYLTRYDRAMKQRNALLKMRSISSIETWEYEMASAASYIVRQRFLATENILKGGKAHYEKISGGKEPLGLQFKANGAGDHALDDASFLKDMYRDQYKRHRVREMELGATMTGPHKDDLIILLGDKDVRSFASEGQQRSVVAALRLAEWNLLLNTSQDTPLMLIDDIGMSLDENRKKSFFSNFIGSSQVFITTTEEIELFPGERSINLTSEASP